MDIFSKTFNDNINNIVGKIVDDTEKNLNSDRIVDNMKFNNLLIDYLRKLGRNVNEDYSDIIPISFELLDVNSKISVLEDCFEKEIAIEKSNIYNSLIEGVYSDEKKNDDFGRMK